MPYKSGLTRREMIDQLVESHYIEYRTLQEFEEKSDEEISELYFKYVASDSGNYDVPEAVCPFCQFVEYSEKDLASYLERVYCVPRESVFDRVKQVNPRREKLYDIEYIAHVCTKYNLEPARIVAGWKDRFNSYRSLKNFLRK